MKITNLRLRIAAALASAGLALPVAAHAAPLNTNLVVNPSFENVDPNTSVGGYGALLILDWAGGGGAYDYSQGYDNGGPLAGGGDKYFSPNASDGSISQDIDVSSGDTATAIASGLGRYSLSAFFTSYLSDGDIGMATAEFLDVGNASLGSDSIAASDTTTWMQESTSGAVPVGTSTVRLTLEGIGVTFGPDGYTDLVDFQVSAIPEPSTLVLAGMGLAGAGILCLRRLERKS